jgi:hypothetical protein
VGQTNSDAQPNVGFLTMLQEASGYLGGYLVLNGWGRPLEFRLSTAVQPNRVQQILYADTLKPYLYADLIGKALVEKATLGVQLILTDCEPALDLRRHVGIPVAWVAAAEDSRAESRVAGANVVRPAQGKRGPVVCHPCFAGDVEAARDQVERLEEAVGLLEPFARIREAVGEARKMGVTNRA